MPRGQKHIGVKVNQLSTEKLLTPLTTSPVDAVVFSQFRQPDNEYESDELGEAAWQEI
jgi:hypothetical protein